MNGRIDRWKMKMKESNVEEMQRICMKVSGECSKYINSRRGPRSLSFFEDAGLRHDLSQSGRCR